MVDKWMNQLVEAVDESMDPVTAVSPGVHQTRAVFSRGTRAVKRKRNYGIKYSCHSDDNSV